MLTQARLKELMTYDPLTGHFVRLPGTDGRGRKPGQKVGSPHASGYQSTMIDGKNYMVHRLAWLYMTGDFPLEDIDHADGDRSNNIWINLRACSRAENMQNKTGVLGVWQVGKRWRARIRAFGTTHHIGYFDTEHEGVTAYLQAKARIHTFNPTLRK